MMRLLLIIFLLTSCTALDRLEEINSEYDNPPHVPAPYNASEGWNESVPEYWPDDGWAEGLPEIHTGKEMAEIKRDSHNICEFTNKAECRK